MWAYFYCFSGDVKERKDNAEIKIKKPVLCLADYPSSSDDEGDWQSSIPLIKTNLLLKLLQAFVESNPDRSHQWIKWH